MSQNDPYVTWLQVLAGLLSPVYPGELKEPLERLLPHLRAEFSAQYLTPESARAVAAADRFGPCPDWGAMCKALRGYVRDVRPINAGLLPSPRVPDGYKPSPDEIARMEAIGADFKRSVAERQLAEEQARTPLRDVSLKGQALEIARAAAPGFRQ